MTESTQKREPFARRTAALLIGIGASAFFGGMIVMAFADYFEPNSGGRTNTYSSSAIGHMVAAEMLEDLGFDLTINRRDLSRAQFRGDTIILAEPTIGTLSEETVASLDQFSNVVLVLPKRSGVQHPVRPNWIATAVSFPTTIVERVADDVLDDVAIVRAEDSIDWTISAFGDLRPELSDTQLVISPDLNPIFGSDAGMLIGVATTETYRLFIISDPDLIANHSIAEGDNAAIFAQLLDMITGPSLIWDETIHGYIASDNIWRSAFEPPLLAITIAASLTITILLLTTSYRFGSPLRMPPPFAQGKASLVVTAASLIADGRHYEALLRRYLSFGIRRVLRQLNAQARPLDESTIGWLTDLSRARGLSEAQTRVPHRILDALTFEQAGRAELARLVRDFFEWRTEILNESGRP